MSDTEAAAWATFKTQAQTGADGQPRKKAKKTATGDQAAHASTVQASAPEITAANIAHALSWQSIAGLVVITIGLLWGVVWLFRKIVRVFGSKDSDGFAEADYKIPNCTHVKTADGFIVTFSRWPTWLEKLDPANTNPFVTFVIVIPFIVGLVYFLLKMMVKPTRIEVTSDAVIVDGKKYRRADFGKFFISYSKQIKRDTENKYAAIAYNYGRQKIEMPYLWREDQATDFLASLNNDLRAVPDVNEKNKPIPGQQTEVF